MEARYTQLVWNSPVPCNKQSASATGDQQRAQDFLHLASVLSAESLLLHVSMKSPQR